MREQCFDEAEALITSILDSWMQTYGMDHHDTLEALGTLADLQRRMGKEHEAKALEKKLLEAGWHLLKSGRQDMGPTGFEFKTTFVH